MRRGAARSPLSRFSSSHQALVPPVATSPPRPSMVPSPTTPELAGLVTPMSALHDEVPVLFPPHLAAPATRSKSAGSCDANSVVPVSSQRLTPDFSDSPPDTNPVLSPSVARRTAWPTGQALIAA